MPGISRNASIKAHRPLRVHPGKSFKHVTSEGGDCGFCLSLAKAGFDDQPGFPQVLQTTAGGMRSGIGAADHHAAEPCLKNGVHTGWRLAMVAAGFEGDEEVSAHSIAGGCANRFDLCVGTTEAGMPALSDEFL